MRSAVGLHSISLALTMRRNIAVCLMLACAPLAGGCTSSVNSDWDQTLAQAKPAGIAAAPVAVGAATASPTGPATLVTEGQSPPASAKASRADATSFAGKPETGAIALPTSAQSFLSMSTPGNAFYKIGPQDVIEVSVYKVPDLSRVVQVADLGTINLPLVGETQVVGKTAQEVERDLTAKLGAKYLQNPQVNVMVREYNSQRITVEGAVKTPGVFPIRGKSTLLQFIAQVGGINTDVANEEVVVFRVRDGKRYAAKFDIAAIRNGTAEDPVVQAGDVIVVTPSELKSAFNSFMKTLPLASFLLLTL